MLYVHQMHTLVCRVLKWNYEQLFYGKTFLPTDIRFVRANAPLRLHLIIYMFIFIIMERRFNIYSIIRYIKIFEYRLKRRSIYLKTPPCELQVLKFPSRTSIIDPRSFFYVEKWPGIHFLRPKGSFFVCRKRVITPKPGGEKWPPVEKWLPSHSIKSPE